MKTFGIKELRMGKVWLYAGFNLKRFAIGISIDRYTVSIDLGLFWISAEF